MKRTPLSRRTPLRRSGRLRPVSDRRRKRDKIYPAARDAVRSRAEGRCEVAIVTDPARIAEGCRRPVEQVHHIAGRGGPDPHRLDNLLGVCAFHHRVIHEDPAWAYEHGLMVKRLGGAA